MCILIRPKTGRERKKKKELMMLTRSCKSVQDNATIKQLWSREYDLANIPGRHMEVSICITSRMFFELLLLTNISSVSLVLCIFWVNLPCLQQNA